MKGLLLKDFYLMIKYCRALLLIIIVFAVISAFSDSTFMLYYPCIIVGMLPMTLQTYDEREKWSAYSMSMPYNRAQIVSSKYLIGLLVDIAFVILLTVSQVLGFMSNPQIEISGIISIVLNIIAVSLLSPAIVLPFIFKFGTEKGRIIYYVVIGVFAAGAGMLSAKDTLAPGDLTTALNDIKSAAAFVLTAIVIYIASWLLSIRFYKKKEI